MVDRAATRQSGKRSVISISGRAAASTRYVRDQEIPGPARSHLGGTSPRPLATDTRGTRGGSPRRCRCRILPRPPSLPSRARAARRSQPFRRDERIGPRKETPGLPTVEHHPPADHGRAGGEIQPLVGGGEPALRPGPGACTSTGSSHQASRTVVTVPSMTSRLRWNGVKATRLDGCEPGRTPRLRDEHPGDGIERAPGVIRRAVRGAAWWRTSRATAPRGQWA